MASWDLMQWLEALAYLAAILGGLAAAIHFTIKLRTESISNLRATLAKTWTNEGDVASKDTRFITLEVVTHHGDLICSVHLWSEQNPLEGHIDVAWGKATLSISRLVRNKLCPVATVGLTVTGNNNRLQWTLKEIEPQEGNLGLPATTVLWPSP